ncbi:hypothetical protein N646_0454 [Vibrio alginolyticus NBRC 15630 = ATCC 17749]|uniref:Uncharacterized protein n=1 Tax=Vibrio alginolyticus (strain ATCC 17749 / DSM 2171 / NBRC 15630 / NCIMB 1903 / NCTC 12160 / XII-53) TaxID=1219076 RepID=A0A2I3C0H3_VIBAX|nr:hypothetical protein N646_0454 [Vibrio alginolyticus NBRC 15630 = ATCC 17749]
MLVNIFEKQGLLGSNKKPLLYSTDYIVSFGVISLDFAMMNTISNVI